MPLRVAIQMDPIETVNIEGDSSFVMGLSAEARGHTLWHYHPRQLTLRDGKAIARARPMTLRRKQGDHFTLGDEEVIELSGLDVVLMRQDPPF
ncbi:MAG: glutathione synthase, partial [Dongiaceae bacterium]